jgi:NAD(P)-dependent dehydrogenase (short-subunit alcohol dehydrogenase family)
VAGATYDFGGRTALVTGGASGIGRAAADRLRRSCAAVCVLDLRVGGVEGPAVAADISDADQVASAVADAERLLGGRIDVLVNAAGVAGESVHTADTSDEEWRLVMGVNLDGTFHLCRAVVPGMVERGYGRIVLVASIAGKEGNPMAPAYSASKAGSSPSRRCSARISPAAASSSTRSLPP